MEIVFKRNRVEGNCGLAKIEVDGSIITVDIDKWLDDDTIEYWYKGKKFITLYKSIVSYL